MSSPPQKKKTFCSSFVLAWEKDQQVPVRRINWSLRERLAGPQDKKVSEVMTPWSLNTLDKICVNSNFLNSWAIEMNNIVFKHFTVGGNSATLPVQSYEHWHILDKISDKLSHYAALYLPNWPRYTHLKMRFQKTLFWENRIWKVG